MNPNKDKFINNLKTNLGTTALNTVSPFVPVNPIVKGAVSLGLRNSVPTQNPSATSPAKSNYIKQVQQYNSPVGPEQLAQNTINKPVKTNSSASASGIATLKSPSTSAGQTPSELYKAQLAVDQFNAAKNRGMEGINQKVIPLEFQTGQKAALERQSAFTGTELETRLARLQAKDEADRKAKQQQFENDLALRKLSLSSASKNNTTNNIFGNAKLSTGQKGDIADMLVLQRQIGNLKNLGEQYGGYVGAGFGSGAINAPLASITGSVRPGAQDIRNDIGQIKGFIAKLRGGTSFTPGEEKLLDTYTPKVSDSDAVINSKLTSLNKFINDKIETTVLVSGGNYQSPSQNTIIAPDGQEIELID